MRGRLAAVGSIASIALLAVATGTTTAQARPSHQARESHQATSLWQRVADRCRSLAAEPLPPYPWPIAPVHSQHPVRGYFGDPRTVFTGIGEGAFSFHNGVDISAWPGNHVLPVVSGVVVKVLPDRVVVASSFDRRFQYIHIHPNVRVGERVVASKTVLGLVDPVLKHVHLSEIRGECVVNPLMPGHLTPFHDTRTPVVRSVIFENLAGTRLSPHSLSGKVRVIANAYDVPALPSPFPWGSMPVSPVLIRWKLLTMRGRTLESQTAVDFRYSLPPRHDFCAVYAPGTSQNFAADDGTFHWRQAGVYLYDLTPRPLNTAQLPVGRYRFVVSASNTAGHTGSNELVIAVQRDPLQPPVAVGRVDSRCVES